MAETLASTLNPSPFDPIGAVGNIMGESSGAARGKKARELTEPLMRAKVEAESDFEREQARLEKEQFQRQAQVEEGSVKRLEGLQEGFKQSFEGRPEPQITAFNPEKGMELAGLTALMGVFGGMISGRAGLAAMEGVAEGYRTGQQDLYKIEVEKFNRELDKYKDKIKQAETIYNEAVKLEQARKGAGLAKLKELSPVLQSSYLDAKNRVRPFAGAVEVLAQAKKHEELIEKVAVEAGLKADKKTALKPSATERDRYSMQYELLNLGNQIKQKLQDPNLTKLVDQPRIRAGLFLQEESKLLDQLLQPSIPAEVRQLAILIKKYRNSVYRAESGLAVTAYEAMRQYGANPQPGSTSQVLVDQINVLNDVARRSVRKAETIYPDLAEVGVALQNYENMEKEGRSAAQKNQEIATKADIEATAAANNISIEEAKKRLKERGFQIEGEE